MKNLAPISYTWPLYMGGTSRQAIQELMRHESMASTLIYSYLSPAHLKAASEKFCIMLNPAHSPEGEQ